MKSFTLEIPIKQEAIDEKESFCQGQSLKENEDEISSSN